ncbi:MAG: Asp23/Gls24 family envelope stress response protein [Victivallaceae bacterium]
MKATEKKIAVAPKSVVAANTSVEANPMGEVKIHENVISALVRKATLAIPGVARLAGSQLVDNIAEIVGYRRMQDRAICVSLEEDSNRVTIDVKVNLLFDTKVPVVATAIQKAVIEAVESATGMTVLKVNVIVQELESEVEPESEEEAETPVEPLR